MAIRGRGREKKVFVDEAGAPMLGNLGRGAVGRRSRDFLRSKMFTSGGRRHAHIFRIWEHDSRNQQKIWIRMMCDMRFQIFHSTPCPLRVFIVTK